MINDINPILRRNGMAIRNNNFSQDDLALRISRLGSIHNNIDEFAVELGLPDDLLHWAQNAEADFKAFESEAWQKRLESKRAFSAFRDKQDEARALYQKAKDILRAMIAPHGNADEIARAYSIDGRTPITREGIETALDDLAGQHDAYKAEGAEWVLPDHVVDSLRTLRSEMRELHTIARNKREKAKIAREAYNKRFREDTQRLRLVYEMGVLAWGVQGNAFMVLGMLPKSMIWTKKRPPSPGNLRYEASTRELRWEAIDGAGVYELNYRAEGKGGHWTGLYEGAENRFVLGEGVAGALEFRVRAIAEGKEGHWSGALGVGV